MGKKKAMAAAAQPSWIDCTNYKLEINTDLDFLKLALFPGPRHLDDEEGEHPPLVKRALQVIANGYPDINLQFQVDDNNDVSAVRSKPA